MTQSIKKNLIVIIKSLLLNKFGIKINNDKMK